MKINKDFMAVMRRGKWLVAQTYRKQHESACILFWCMIAAGVIVLLAILIK